ncbi:MAG: hypothetical protein ACI97B_003753, partial [Verrucomicrobiales bacterium]
MGRRVDLRPARANKLGGFFHLSKGFFTNIKIIRPFALSKVKIAGVG